MRAAGVGQGCLSAEQAFPRSIDQTAASSA